MTHRPRRLVLLCGLVPTLAVAALSLWRPALLSHLEFSVHDTLVRAASTTPPDGRVVIVDVDERSLATVGQWPWRRDLVAQLISRLRDQGAATVALDVMFAEADRLDRGDGATDATLATALRRGGVVLGYAMRFDGDRSVTADCIRHPLNLAVVRREDGSDDPYFRATGAVCSLPALTEASAASGFLNAAPDPDGILRRVPLVLELDGHVYPGLALAAVSTATGARGVALRVANANAASLVLSSPGTGAPGPPAAVPLDGKGNLLVRFRGKKRTFPYVSAADVMSGRTAPGTFSDKIVFVGTTALGTREVVATPLDTLFAGVEVQATVADNLLQGDFTSRPEHAVAIETQAVLLLGLVAALLVLRFGLAWGTAAAVAGGVTTWAVAIALLARDGTLLSPLYPSLGLTSALAAMTVAGVTVERRRAEKAGQQTVTSQRLMVQTLLSLTGIRDAETGRHSQRTQRYARVLATELAKHPSFSAYLTPERIELLASLAPLHDIGKVGVPDRVLNKPGGLTPDELAEMRRHPEYGRDVILKAERETGVHDDLTLSVAKDIVYTHHEKWDGSGYPQGLRGEGIPIPGRVMAVVDVYDAIRTRQLYLPSMSDDEAVALISKGRGTHFDPDVVDAFIAVAPVFRSLSEEDAPAPGLRNAS